MAGQAAGVSAPAGPQLWVSHYVGLGDAQATAIAASPSGGTVFVTGDTTGSQTPADYATVAYDAATGAQLWASRYDGPGNGSDGTGAIAVSPDGTRVFVTGSSQGSGTSADYATIAYNAATGARLWVRRYNDSRNGEDFATALALSPDGRTALVTGSSGSGHREDFATIAYSAATGAELWIRRYDGPASSFDVPHAMTVSLDSRLAP